MTEIFAGAGIIFVHSCIRKMDEKKYAIGRQRVGRQVEFWDGTSWVSQPTMTFKSSGEARKDIDRREGAICNGETGRFSVTRVSPDGRIQSMSNATYDNVMAWCPALSTYPAWSPCMEDMSIGEHARREFDGWRWLILRTS